MCCINFRMTFNTKTLEVVWSVVGFVFIFMVNFYKCVVKRRNLYPAFFASIIMFRAKIGTYYLPIFRVSIRTNDNLLFNRFNICGIAQNFRKFS